MDSDELIDRAEEIAAVDYELLSNSLDEAEQLAKDYIDTEKKSLRKL